MRSIAGGNLPLAVLAALAGRVGGCSVPAARKGTCRNQQPFAPGVGHDIFLQLLSLKRRANPHVVAKYAGSPRTTSRTQKKGAAIAAPFKTRGEIAAATRHRRQVVSESDGVVSRLLRLRCARPSSAVLLRIVLSSIRVIST